jgi:NADPH:quinone reductase-like Zn-dependent oxidoreductase
MKYKTLVVGARDSDQSFEVIQTELVAPGPGQVRVKMLYTGVSFGNLMVQAQAPKKFNPNKPIILGYEIVGEVDALGSGVNGFEVGERVISYTGGKGAYTQYTYVSPQDLIKMPAGVDPAAAVCLILNYMTAYQCLHRLAGIETGQSLLITGASGGVGSALLELGKLKGLKMYGTASQSKHPLLLEKGATPIDYKAESFVDFIRRKQPEGLDYAIDGIGGGSEIECMKVIKKGGKVVSYGMRSINAKGNFNLVPIIWNFVKFFLIGRLPLGKKTGMYLIDAYKRSHPDHFREDMQTLLEWLAQGKLKPVIGARLPLTQAKEAHRLLLEGQVTGKIVLDCTS